MNRPNVVFILSDQHNAKLLGCKSHPSVKTPNLDLMAAEGVRFDNAISQNPICTPSRVSWLSGQYCHNHGYYGLSGRNPGGLPTILGQFRRHGYRTAAIGKIHCPEYWVEDDSDLFIETCGGCSIGGSPEYTRYLTDRGILDDEDHLGLKEFGPRGKQSCDGRVSRLSYLDSHEGYSVARAKEFIQRATTDGVPFFVHVSLPKPHQCYTPSQPFWDSYGAEDLVLPPNADYDMEAARKAPHLIQQAAYWRKGDWTLFEPRNFEAARLRKLHGYIGSVSHVDHAVGDLMEYLDAEGLDKKTIVVYSTDHGDFACEHGQIEKAPGICADAITRIPMIWRWKDHFATGHVADEIVESVDFTSTICSLCGLEAMTTSDGCDLSGLLEGNRHAVKSCGVTEFAFSRSLRKDRYRLVYYEKDMFREEYPDGFGELYDLSEDPWEMHNLYFELSSQVIVADLKEELLQFLLRTTRPVNALGANPVHSPQNRTRFDGTTDADGKIDPRVLKISGKKNYR